MLPSDAGDDVGDEGGAGGHGVDDDVLAGGVRSPADGAEPDERGHPDRSGKVAVAAAADGEAFGSTTDSAAIAASTRSFSDADSTRAATLMRASAGTTLSVVPAVATVGVTVVPTSGWPIWSIAET